MSSVRLTAPDELFGHQIPYTHDTVYTNDPDFRERMWMSVSDLVGQDVMICCGMGQYPNRDIQEGWAGITVGQQQYNVRMSRHLRPEIHKMQVKPLHIQVVEPLERMLFVLEENPSGIEFEIEVFTEFTPHIEDHHLEIRNGKVIHDLSRYNIVTSASGVVKYPGGEKTLTRESWRGGRDHSWGIQPDQQNTSTPTQHVSRSGTLYTLCYVQFTTWGAFFYMMERAPGIYDYLSGSVFKKTRSGVDTLRVVGVEHEYEWFDGWPVVEAKKTNISLLTEDGNRHQFSAEFYRPKYFLRSGLYMGWRGWWQGADKGPYFLEHDIWDLSDVVSLREYAVAGGGYDHHAKCVSSTGEPGHGAFEYFLTPGYPKYREIQPAE